MFAIGNKKTPKKILSVFFKLNSKIKERIKPKIKIIEVGLGKLYGSDAVKNL